MTTVAQLAALKRVLQEKERKADEDTEQTLELLGKLSIGTGPTSSASGNGLKELLEGNFEPMRLKLRDMYEMLCPRRDFEKSKTDGGLNEQTFKLSLMMLLRLDPAWESSYSLTSEKPIYEYKEKKRQAFPSSYMDLVLQMPAQGKVILFELKYVPVKSLRGMFLCGTTVKRTEIEQHLGYNIPRIQRMTKEELGQLVFSMDEPTSTEKKNMTVADWCNFTMTNQLLPYFNSLARVPISSGENLFFTSKDVAREYSTVHVYLYSIVMVGGNTYYECVQKSVSKR